MKIVPILAAIALALPATATAQSISDTHELVWHPAGKTPASTYRPRDNPKCAKRFEHRSADKGRGWLKARCAAAAEAATAPTPIAE